MALPKLNLPSLSSTNYSTYSNTNIPSTKGNVHIYQPKVIDGTVFIAFGACLGFIFLIILSLWAILTFKSWQSARSEYKRREIESKYQFDPFYISNNTNQRSTLSLLGNEKNNIFMDPLSGISTYEDLEDFDTSSSSLTTSSSSNSSPFHSDISEKILKSQKSSGGNNSNTSTLIAGNGNGPYGLHARQDSMFISPTEILQSEAWNSSNISLDSTVDTLTGNQLKKTSLPIISNGSMNNSFQNFTAPSDKSSFQYIPKSSMINLSTTSFANSPAPSIPTSTGQPTTGTPNTNKTSNTSNSKHKRAPSMMLDDLLNE
ncbi:hypothetical protein TBLA_0E03130 [Henningerozyma blattae CBS 6284]|uniref:Vacuolar membrane protein n=1 Tax=Henningerozyma blattae (strain ATCC 34711 / CBS 6284 / DSM 70876 / NBRC 10599 / NRRL Y-10934 / UCD 77-7) TaxID=1071380 RepID=I2H4R5_HENB6|nr:hypothetical protein TBLA_0E03130 [Tetrapisispora blattae CBS 6284]CCH61367.1 hypothetical protein TBLA_0E03130 [Tetrapisispora blattae CBS 6284]